MHLPNITQYGFMRLTCRALDTGPAKQSCKGKQVRNRHVWRQGRALPCRSQLGPFPHCTRGDLPTQRAPGSLKNKRVWRRLRLRKINKTAWFHTSWGCPVPELVSWTMLVRCSTPCSLTQVLRYYWYSCSMWQVCSCPFARRAVSSVRSRSLCCCGVVWAFRE